MSADTAFIKQEEGSLKQQEELFKYQIQKMGRLTSNLATFNKILHGAKEAQIHDRTKETDVVRNTEAEIRNAEKQMAAIREGQSGQFLALSKEDQRRICKVKGLEHLEHLSSKTDEKRPAVNAPKASDHLEVLPKGRQMFEDTNRRVQPSGDLGNAHPCTSDVEIEELLAQNRVRQRVWAGSLESSREEILKMQEDMRRLDKEYGWAMPRANLDVEAFLRAREVERDLGDEEDQEVEWKTEEQLTSARS